MIRFPSPETLAPESQHALTLLADQARLLPGDDADAVEMRVVSDASASDGLDAARHLRPRDGWVEISDAALRLVTRIAGVVDEQRSGRADRFGRVPVEDNYLAARGTERDPIVSRFAVALRKAVVAAAGRRRVALLSPWPERRRWAMALSHDLDVVALWPAFTGLRAAELARKARVRELASSLAAAARAALGDPVWSAARRVLDVERAAGVRSTWFVITATPTWKTVREGDVTYLPESPAARRILRAVLDEGHEVGLHGSFETWTHVERFRAQRDRLAGLTGLPVRGVRQHFLRMRPGTTHAAMMDAGFAYDSTCGFPDRNGFRAGVADVVQVWDDARKLPLALDVAPFVWMDRALSKYRGVEDPRAWVNDAIATARSCREVDGLWTGIWHPNLAAPLGFPGAERAFDQLCAELTAESPWSATLGEIVDWRRSRRAMRAAGVDADGTVALRGGAGRFTVTLEDPAGRSMPSRPA